MKSKIFVIFILAFLINFNLEGSNTKQINKIPQLYDKLAKPDTNKKSEPIKKINTSSNTTSNTTSNTASTTKKEVIVVKKTSNTPVLEDDELDEIIYSESEDELEDIPDDSSGEDGSYEDDDE
jgi:hypothetical protein